MGSCSSPPLLLSKVLHSSSVVLNSLPVIFVPGFPAQGKPSGEKCLLWAGDPLPAACVWEYKHHCLFLACFIVTLLSLGPAPVLILSNRVYCQRDQGVSEGSSSLHELVSVLSLWLLMSWQIVTAVAAYVCPLRRIKHLVKLHPSRYPPPEVFHVAGKVCFLWSHRSSWVGRDLWGHLGQLLTHHCQVTPALRMAHVKWCGIVFSLMFLKLPDFQYTLCKEECRIY